MANVISYKGQKYVRVDSVTKKKVHRTDMVVTMVNENYRILKELVALLPKAIQACKTQSLYYEKELMYAKQEFALLSSIKGKEEKIYELNEKGDELFLDAISQSDSQLKSLKEFVKKYS